MNSTGTDNNSEFRLSELTAFLKDEGIIREEINHPGNDLIIRGFSPLDRSRPETLAWMKSQTTDWTDFKASVVICSKEFSPPEDASVVFIPVENPRLAFARALMRFHPGPAPAGIEESAQIGKDCRIGNNVYIGRNVVLGNNVCVGDDTVIHANVSVYADTEIGCGCIIHSSAVIGADGFGYVFDEKKQLLKFLQIGGVTIGDNVEIGANTCIDRGALGNTIVENGVKINNLCHIAHNVRIGEASIITACTYIGGSAVIGKECWISPSATIRNGISIGAGAMVGLGSVLTKDVAENTFVVGNPARPAKIITK